MGKCKLNISNDALQALYCKDGLRMREIADMFGCAVSAVSQRLKAAGVDTRKPHDYPTTEKQRAAWTEIGKRGMAADR